MAATMNSWMRTCGTCFEAGDEVRKKDQEEGEVKKRDRESKTARKRIDTKRILDAPGRRSSGAPCTALAGY
jgi:hypothetical protein